MVRLKKFGMGMLALTVAALTSPLLMFSQNGKSQKMPNLELRLQPGKLINGVPESFTFVFVNISDHDVLMPQPSRCGTSTNGIVYLNVELNPPPLEHERRMWRGLFRCGADSRSGQELESPQTR